MFIFLHPLLFHIHFCKVFGSSNVTITILQKYYRVSVIIWMVDHKVQLLMKLYN